MDYFDPTTNRIPVGLLTQEESDTLKTWPHGWETFTYRHPNTWITIEAPSWVIDYVYRGKPAPAVKVGYANVYKFYGDIKVGGVHLSKCNAVNDTDSNLPHLGLIKLEVVDGKLTSVSIED